LQTKISKNYRQICEYLTWTNSHNLCTIVIHSCFMINYQHIIFISREKPLWSRRGSNLVPFDPYSSQLPYHACALPILFIKYLSVFRHI
jgi:hypothetical protein